MATPMKRDHTTLNIPEELNTETMQVYDDNMDIKSQSESMVGVPEEVPENGSHGEDLNSLMNDKTVSIMDCTFCEEYFDTVNKKILHLRDAHAKDIIYICENCLETFHEKHDLEDHVRNVHKLKFTCSTCGQNFLSLDSLDHHINFNHQENAEDTNG